MNLEPMLRSALARRQPPVGFAERVLASIYEPSPWRSPLSPGRSPWWRWLALAAASVVLLLGIRHDLARREKLRMQQAVAQLHFALKVTGEKLDYVEQKLLQLSRDGVEAER